AKEAEQATGEHARPRLIAQFRQREGAEREDDREDRHVDGGCTLRDPVFQAVVRADDDTLFHHSATPMIKVSAMLTPRTILEDMRAASSSRPLCMSSNRKRMPAQK